MTESNTLNDWLLPAGCTDSLKRKSINYVYSKSDKGLVDIATVSERKASGLILRGLLDGNYSCTGCGGAVVARLGKKNAHHFAHHATTNCAGNPTTNLHNLAEEIIITLMRVYLPPMAVKRGESSWIRVCKEDRSFVALNSFGERTDSETKRIPDVLLFLGSYELIIEVAVTHFCDDEKKQKYRNARKPSIEIDLSRVNRDISKADLTKLLLGDGCNPRELFTWIYHPAYDSAVMAAEYEELLKRQKEEERQEAIRLESEERAKQLELREKEEAERIALEVENEKKRLKLELKESLSLRTEGNKLPDWRQDLVWYHDVHKGKMRATDWEYQRKQLSERCEHLDKIIQDLSGQIAEERVARNLENEEKKKQWLKAALINQSKGLTLTGIQQDLVWYNEVVNGRMAAIDWVIKRNTAEARCFFLDKEIINYSEEISQAEAEKRAIKAEKESAEMERTSKLERHRLELIYAEKNAYKEEADREEMQRQRKVAKAEAKEKALAKAAEQAEKDRLSKLCSDSHIIHKKLIAEHFRRRKAGLPYDPEEAKRAIAENMDTE